MQSLEYLNLRPGDTPPRLEGASPFKAVVVVESDVTPEWQGQVSDRLVRAGCRYMMAWGKECSSWDSSVDEANLIVFNYGEISDDDLVITAWHDNEPLEEAFWLSQFCAMHPSLKLQKTYIVHISTQSTPAEMLEAFRRADKKRRRMIDFPTPPAQFIAP